MTAAVVTGAPGGTPAPIARPLPRLREDLRLLPPAKETAGAGPGSAGERLIYDPLRHRYLRLDAESVDLLTIWHQHEQPSDLAAAASRRFAHAVDEARVQALATFLVNAELTQQGAQAGWLAAWQRRESQRHHWLVQIAHTYLFFRMPLLSPERGLARLLPYVRPLASWPVLAAIAMLGIAGLYLVSRQWDAFLATHAHIFTPAGALTLGVVVLLVKALHECGHGFVAAHYGCRVPTLGVAFMVMVPMLYTDVTDAWRLTDRRARLAIDAAGIAVEIALAALALFAWPFLPEGPARTAAFLIASASLIMTLGLNLNPFMRFDGYYLLADLWGVDNLQPRAFALGRWQLRELLFAPREPCPEAFPAAKRRLLVLYAWSIWLYRLIVFTGIALLVYHMFFKLLGIVLFLIEIVFFIAAPIWREVAAWWRRRAAFWRTRRAKLTGAAGILLIAVVLLPWSGRVDIPAVLEVRETVRLFPVRAARVAAVAAVAGQALDAGAVIVTLEAPEIETQLRLARTRLAVTELRLSRRMADTQDREQSLVLEDELRALRSRIEGLTEEKAQLTLRAPRAATVLELNPALHPGRWLAKSEAVATLGVPGRWIVRGYVAEGDVGRIKPGTRGRFIAHESLLGAIAVELTEVAAGGTPAIELPEVMSVHGGAIAVEEDRQHRLVPVSAQYMVTLEPVPDRRALAEVGRVIRGTVVLEGTAESIALRAWRQVLNVLIRETGF